MRSPKNKCWFCGVVLTEAAGKATGNGTWPSYATVDHLTPQSKGGTDNPDNLVDACLGCNASKGGRTLEEYRMSIYFRTPPGVAVKSLMFALSSGFVADHSAIEKIIEVIKHDYPLPRFWSEMNG